MVKIGDKLDYLTVISINKESKECICECECGNTTTLKTDSFRRKPNRKTVFMCDECRTKYRKIHAPKIGRRYGKLVVTEFLGNTKYKCHCDCGNDCIVDTKNLRDDTTSKRCQTSCGCDVTHYNKDESFFEKIDTEEKAYILGMLASDGCVHNDIIKLTLKSDDIDMLYKIANVMQYDGPIKTQEVDTILPQGTPCHSEVATLVICSQKLVNDLLKYGITENKSRTLLINFKLIPKRLMRHFFRGLYDGDGTCNITRTNRICYKISIVSSDKMISYISNYFKEQFPELKASIIPHGNITQISYGSREAYRQLSDYFYKDATFYLERKYQRYLKNLKLLKLIDSVSNKNCIEKHNFYEKIDFSTGEFKD